MALSSRTKKSNIVYLVSEGGTKLCRALLLKRVEVLRPADMNQNWSMDKFLETNKMKILPKLNASSKNIVFPLVKVETNLEKWDVCVFCCVLKEACELGPELRMFLDHLKRLRNKFFHWSDSPIDDYKYDDTIKKLQVIFGKVLDELNDDDLRGKINDMFNKVETAEIPDDELSRILEAIDKTNEQVKHAHEDTRKFVSDQHLETRNTIIKGNKGMEENINTLIEFFTSNMSKFIEQSAKANENEPEAQTPELVLRTYQQELAEIALLGKNTIVCAETGSGKTWVALHIIKEHLQKATNGPKKVVFMARTGALIKQQFDRFQKYLPQFNSKLITGDDDESRMLNMFLEQEYDILCFTPQILVNNLDSKAIKSLCEFSLLVLDECHHTRGDEPYNRLMRRYLIEKQKGVKRLPQVVGLTASIGVGKSRTEAEAMDYILRVCASLDVELLSTVERNIVELRKNTNMPEEETIPLKKLQNDPCKNIIIKAMEDTEEMLQENAFLQPELIDLITDKHPRNKESQEYNKWTVDVMKQAEMKVDNHEISRDISTSAKYLNIYNSALEINKLLPNRDVIKFLAEKHKLESEHKQKLTDMERKLFQNLLAVQKEISLKARDVENPNVRILSDTLRKMIDKKGEDSRAMVFVKARATCKALAAFLDKDMEHIAVKASPLYGKESRGGDDGMTESVQTDILDRFRNGYFKILVCTSVGNEGIDVPDCNIVLSYEYSADEVTKIQMKGRARKHGATAVVMGSEAVVEQDRTNAFKAAMMYKALAKVKQLDPKVVHRKVAMFQKEETNKHQWKVDIEQMKKSRKSEEDYKILCRRCNTVACYASDVRKMGHDHIVIDREFADKINRKAHSKPKMYDGLHKKYKMFCKKCPLDWGIIGTRDGLDCMILKIISFKFLNLRTNGIETYKKWIDVPYQVPEITLEDLPRLIGETAPEDQTE